MCVRILYSPAHPRSGVYIYRVEWHGKSVVFASDNEGYVHTNQRLIEFARDTDLLIHDAQYTDEEYIHRRQSFGHSTPEMACAVARACGAKRLVLTHHNPSYDDRQIAEIERAAQTCFPGAVAAYEGLEIEL
jgi:ribonuclease BN (tRNA processing enzyme)